MKKITTMLLALWMLDSTTYGQDQVFLPSYRALGSVQMTKFHKIAGNSALYEMSQSTGGTVYSQTKLTADTSSIIAYMGPIKEVTTAVFSDTVIVPDTTESYLKVYLYSDSMATTLIDSSSYALLTYDPIISSYSITPIVGGYVSEVTINTGNARCSVKKQTALYPDTTFQGPFTYRNDTVFGIGVSLVLRDSVKNLSTPQVPLGFCDRLLVKQLLQWNNQIYDVSDCDTTLVQASQPIAQWFGNPTSTSPTSISWTVVTESFGLPGVLTIYIHDQLSGVLIDSIVDSTGSFTGPLYTNGNKMNLIPATWYVLTGTFKTAFGIPVPLSMKVVQTQALPFTLTNAIVNVTVGLYVEIEFSYTVPSGASANFTSGYGGFSTNVLDFSTGDPGTVNNGTFTRLFPLPAVAGWYTAHVYGYNEQTFVSSVEDTAHFYVSSLTGVEEIKAIDRPVSVLTNNSNGEIDIQCTNQKTHWYLFRPNGTIARSGQGNDRVIAHPGMYFLKTDEADAIKIVVH